MSQQPSTTQMSSRWAGIAGIGFALLAVVGFIIAGGPNYNESDQTWVAWFQDSNHRGAQIAGMFLVLAAVLLLVIFFATLRRQAVAAGGSAQASALSGAAGVMLATTVAVGTVIHNEVSAAMQFAPNNFPVPGADVLRTLDNLGFGVGVVAAGFAAALFVASLAHTLRGAAIVPGWLVTAGYVVGVLLLFSFAFFPLFLLPLWILAVGIAVAARASRPLEYPEHGGAMPEHNRRSEPI